MKRILFTGGGGAGNELLWQLLSDRYDMHFGDADLYAIDPKIPTSRRHLLPLASSPDFVMEMVKLCNFLKIDLLIPGVDEELLLLAKESASFAPTQLLLPNADYVEKMLDKLQMIDLLTEKNIAVPTSQNLESYFYGINYPCISKPRSGRGSRDVRILNSVEEAEALKFTLGAEAGKMMLQNKIEGIEYTVQMIADSKRNLYSIVPVKVDVKRGITIRAVTDKEPIVIEACRLIHEAIPTNGCYNIQLILTSKGQALPFEINPRVSTTFCLVVAAGIDPISIYLRNDESYLLKSFKSGIKLSRHWSNYISSK